MMKPIQKLELASSEAIYLVSFNNCVQPFREHFHPWLTIGKIIENGRICQVEEDCFTLKPGDLVVMNPGEVHSCLNKEEKPLVYLALQIPVSVLETLGLLPWAGLIHHIEDPDLSSNFENLLQDLTVSTPENRTEILKRFLARTADKYKLCTRSDSLPSAFQSDPEIRKAVEFMVQNREQPFHLDALCSLLHISRSAFYRKWNKLMKISPAGFHNCLRIIESDELLNAGIRLVEIAARMGWSDQSDFSRWYLRTFGYTPGQKKCLNRPIQTDNEK